MQNFRQFEAGPDPFGRKFQVWFKWLQTAISIRGSDTVDVKFVLENEQAGSAQKTIALPHLALLALSRETGRPMDDAWCPRLAAGTSRGAAKGGSAQKTIALPHLALLALGRETGRPMDDAWCSRLAPSTTRH